MGFLINVVRRKFKQFQRKVQDGKFWLRGDPHRSAQVSIEHRLKQTNWVAKKQFVDYGANFVNNCEIRVRKKLEEVVTVDVKRLPTKDAGLLAGVIHQAGHTVMLWKATRQVRLHGAFRENSSRSCFTHPECKRHLKTVDEVVSMLAMQLGGCMAEKLCIKDSQLTFCKTDLIWATVYAKRLASLTRNQLELCNISPKDLKMRKEITISYWVDLAFEIAHAFLLEHIEDVMKVARALVEIGTLRRKELTNILGPQVLYEERVETEAENKE